MTNQDSSTLGLPATKQEKIGIVLLNMGGPDSLETVGPFLYNLFSDPEIIKLPMSFLFQKILAWMIVNSRLNEAVQNYDKLDSEQWGGGSPQLPITRDQGKALKEKLDDKYHMDAPIYIAMRYWHPFTNEALEKIENDGITHLIAVTLYPHFSYTTTGSSLNELRRGLKKRGLTNKVKLSIVSGYCKKPAYLKALAGCIEEGLNNNTWTCDLKDVQILFSAHSLPVQHVKRTGDPYPKLIQACARSVMETYFPSHAWDMAYQSKVGNMPWLGPATDGVLAYYAGEKRDNILMVPISFVSEHVETLVEIDLDYMGQARDMGIEHIARAPVMNTRPDFIQLLADCVAEKVKSDSTQCLSDWGECSVPVLNG